jgi:cell division GTPase FtsZ
MYIPIITPVLREVTRIVVAIVTLPVRLFGGRRSTVAY